MVLQLQDFVQGTSGAGAAQGCAVCLCVLHPVTLLRLLGCCDVGSPPKPANELQILIPFEKDTGAKLHVYGQQKDNDLEQLWSEISNLQFSD